MSMQPFRRIALVFVAVVFLLGAVLAPSVPAADDAKKADGQQADKKSGELPLKKLVMFSSGIGFFEHRGQVKNDAEVEMKFNVQNINDLLKSMVLEDEGGGRISTVTYGSRDPVTKTLKTFAIDLTTNPTLGQILNQVRGEQVEVSAPDLLSGVILGVETRQKDVGDHKTVDVEMLNLLTDGGFRSIGLDTVGRIKLLDEKLDAELRQALKVLAMSHATDKKTVSLNFLGNGERRVRVGYIQETPVWKTSYRLVLKDNEAPFLQGWAIVENTTDEDWNKVDLTLVSGRPISFIMDLYQPLYVPRPVVQPELYASLRPQSYEQDMDKMSGIGVALNNRHDSFKSDEKPKAAAPRPSERRLKASSLFQSGKAADAGPGVGGPGPGVMIDGSGSMNLSASVQSLAQAGDVGELFQYKIDTPVTLPRQQSAMLPIVNESVKGEKVSIYNPAVQPKHPLNGLRLTNSTDLHLMQGPITVFDGGAYAGDAKIDDLQPGTERLISYALDLDVEVAPESKGNPEQLLSVRLRKGVLYREVKYERNNKYVVKNSGKKAKKVLVEYPFDASWKLIAPKEPAEKTRGMYRFAVNAEPGKPATLGIHEEQIVNRTVAITNLDNNLIAIYLNSKVVSEKVKKALEEVVRRKLDLEKLVASRQKLDMQISEIDQDQARIRQNMPQLEHNSDLYRRYVSDLTKQEDKLGTLRSQVHELMDQEQKDRQSLDKFLSDLDVA